MIPNRSRVCGFPSGPSIGIIAGHDAQFALGDVQLAAVLRRVAELDPAHENPHSTNWPTSSFDCVTAEEFTSG